MIKLLDLVYVINPNHGYLPFNESEFTCIQDFYQHRNCSFKLTEEELQQRTKGQAMCAVKLVEKLGYRPMTLKILKKMRDTFRSEECEYCGRLFFSRMDYEPHVRTHTGRLYNISIYSISYLGFSCVFICRTISVIQSSRSRTMLKNL